MFWPQLLSFPNIRPKYFNGDLRPRDPKLLGTEFDLLKPSAPSSSSFESGRSSATMSTSGNGANDHSLTSRLVVKMSDPSESVASTSPPSSSSSTTNEANGEQFGVLSGVPM